MTPVIHCSVGNISLFHIGSFRPSREIQTKRFHGSERYSRVASPSYHRLLQPQTAFHLISIYKRRSWSSASRSRTLSAAGVGTDVTVEDSNPSPSGETSDESSEAAPGTAEASEQAEAGTDAASSTPKLGRNIRKSEMPPLKNDDLVPGASFTGKVRSIKPFGVFVDIGAFTEGLVHISRVSDGFVKDISSLFTVGQEVEVRIVEANKETGRISLTMRTSGDYVKETPKAASGGRNPTATAIRSSPRQTKEREEAKKTDEANYVRGQSLTGTVKNTTKSGSFVTLPDGNEGFLPREEEAVALFTLIGHSALEVGQQVRVKVLNVARGQVTLTMKEGEDDEDDLASLNTELKRGWSRGTNAFELAFRRNKEISALLDQRENTKVPEVQAATGEAVGTGLDAEVGSDQSLDKETEASKAESLEIDSSTTEDKEIDSTTAEEDRELSKIESIESDSSVATSEDDSSVDDKLIEPPSTVSATEAEIKEDSSSTEAVTAAVEEITPPDEESGENFSASLSSVATDVPVPEVSDASSQEGIEDSTSVSDIADEQTGAADSTSASSVPETEDKPDEPEESSAVEEVPVTASSESVDKEPAVVTEEVAASSEKTAEVAAAGAEQASTTTATISPALVKQLREATGAGMMDCKKALAESGGDITKAQEFLRKKGLAAADKRAGRTTAEGRMGSYIHDSRIGVLIEVNCETDFVSRGHIFKELVDDLAMQVAACPQVKYISIDDVPEEVVNKETELEMQREDLLSMLGIATCILRGPKGQYIYTKYRW